MTYEPPHDDRWELDDRDPFASFASDPFEDVPGAAQERGPLGFSAASLAGKPVPPREWLCEPLIPSPNVTLLGGDGGTGKSLLTAQLAVSAALGRRWIGNEVRQGPVLYLSAEDDRDELHRRLADIIAAEQASFEDLADLTLESFAGGGALLANVDKGGGLVPTPLFDRIEETAAQIRPVLIVLDTLADLFPGNENDRAQARQFIGMLRGLAIRHRCAVVMLAHPSLSGLNSGSGSSGSTGWSNSVRSRLYFERVLDDGYEANPDARRLVTKKANYARVGSEIALTWRDGVFVADEPETGLDRLAKSSKAERVFLKLLRLFTEQGRRVNHLGSTSYAPTVFSKHPEAEGVTKQAFRNAMETLLGGGKIAISEEGPPSRRVKFIAEAGE